MFLDAKFRGLESLDAMAGRALATVGSFGELPTVRVGLVAVGTLLKGKSLLEVALSVALHAFHLRMLAE